MKTCQYEYSVEPLLAVKTTTPESYIPLPSWMSYTQPKVTINAVNSSQIGVHDLWMKQVRLSTQSITFFKSFILTVECVIVRFDPPPQLSLAELSYTVYNDKKLFNFTPYVQWPPCDYKPTEAFAWTIQKNAPIT